MAHTLVDSISELSILLDSLRGIKNSPPSLFVDLEGNNLSRHGTISIIQLYVHPQGRVYLIDVHRLGTKAFNTPGADGSTLRSVLESETISKVIFDVRNDSNALHGLFNISLAGAIDFQLMELATRAFAKKRVSGLKTCIEKEAPMTTFERQQWIKTKDEGTRLFDPKIGGSYAVFDERPLSDTIQQYCIQDVLHLPNLWRIYSARLTPKTRSMVIDATQARIEESQRIDFDPKGQHKVFSPWPGWPTTPKPRTPTWSNLQRHPGNLRHTQINDPSKLSSPTITNTRKKGKVEKPETSLLNLNMASLALDTSSRSGVTPVNHATTR